MNIYKTLVLAFMTTQILNNSFGQTPNDIVPLDKAAFNKIINGENVELFSLTNKNGLLTEITNYGGRVVSLWVPDRAGKYTDIVLGYESLDGYLNSNEGYYGALIGRYANRIAKGRFNLNNVEYTLATNNGENHLHGGKNGFNNVVWEARLIDNSTLELKYKSLDGEEGYPGNLEVKVVYKLTDENELKVEYWATTDKSTPVNLTHHSFFNLHGDSRGSINDHILQINANNYTPVNESLIPTGELADVKGTPMDFIIAKAIGKDLDKESKQLEYGNGYDFNWIINQNTEGLNFAAKVVEPVSGRIMEVYTNEPGMQFYGGNFLNGNDIGKNNRPYRFQEAFCLETQHYPDSPNQANFPNTVLNPGEEYYSVCIYKFLIAE
jgi:aldose 1-epimerase